MSGVAETDRPSLPLCGGDGLRQVVSLACNGDPQAAAEVLARATRQHPLPGRDAVLQVLSQFGHAVEAGIDDAAALTRQLDAITRARRLGSFEWLQSGGMPSCPIERGRTLLRVFAPWLAMRSHALVAFATEAPRWLAVAVHRDARSAFVEACDRLGWERRDPAVQYADPSAAQGSVRRQLDDIMRTLERHAEPGWRRLIVEAVRWPEDYAQGLVSRETEADCWFESRRGDLLPLSLPDAGWASASLTQLRSMMLTQPSTDQMPAIDWRRLRLQRRASRAEVEVEIDPPSSLRSQPGRR